MSQALSTAQPWLLAYLDESFTAAGHFLHYQWNKLKKNTSERRSYMYHNEFERLLENGWGLNNFLQGVRLSSKQGEYSWAGAAAVEAC